MSFRPVVIPGREKEARRRDELQTDAFRLGRRLHRDKPGAFIEQIANYWKAWRSKRAARTS